MTSAAEFQPHAHAGMGGMGAAMGGMGGMGAGMGGMGAGMGGMGGEPQLRF